MNVMMIRLSPLTPWPHPFRPLPLSPPSPTLSRKTFEEHVNSDERERRTPSSATPASTPSTVQPCPLPIQQSKGQLLTRLRAVRERSSRVQPPLPSSSSAVGRSSPRVVRPTHRAPHPTPAQPNHNPNPLPPSRPTPSPPVYSSPLSRWTARTASSPSVAWAPPPAPRSPCAADRSGRGGCAGASEAWRPSGW